MINSLNFKMNVMEKKTNMPAWGKVSEVEIVYRANMRPSERPLINSSRDAYETFLQVWDMERIDYQEEFKVLLLNTANRVMGVYELSAGGLTATVADPRLILAVALKGLSVAIIIGHNHPSGNLRPSAPDNDLTAKIRESARFFDIKLLDHIIVTRDGYYSFADEGLL